MALYRFDVIFDADNAMPADSIVNTWHFNNPAAGLPPSDFDNVRDMLEDFYNAVPAGSTISIASQMPGGLFQNTVRVRAYNLDDPLPRVPVYQSTFTATLSSSGDPMPTEVSLVLSISAAPVSGVPMARRRNRKYLGPFVEGANGTDARPSLALRLTIARAARDLLDAAQASASWGWRVYSPTTGDDFEPVSGWVDNAWDTQRRRGLAATERTVWSEDLPA